MIQNTEIVKAISCDFLEVNLRADGIVHVHIKANTLIEIRHQEEMYKMYWSVTDIHRPFIFSGEEFVSITAEARSNAIKMESKVPVSGTVLHVRNLGQKILADYYYKFNKPLGPLMVTRDFEKGIAWIHENFELQPIG